MLWLNATARNRGVPQQFPPEPCTLRRSIYGKARQQDAGNLGRASFLHLCRRTRLRHGSHGDGVVADNSMPVGDDVGRGVVGLLVLPRVLF